jgi:hypothetical protein
MDNKPNANNLKQVIWGTLLDLRNRKVDVKHANAVSAQAKALMSVVRTELQISQFNKSAGKYSSKNLVDFSK